LSFNEKMVLQSEINVKHSQLAQAPPVNKPVVTVLSALVAQYGTGKQPRTMSLGESVPV